MINNLWKRFKRWRHRAERNRRLIAQTGYVYIFQAEGVLKPEAMESEERRIKEGLAAGVLITDARTRLIYVKPRLEVRVK